MRLLLVAMFVMVSACKSVQRPASASEKEAPAKASGGAASLQQQPSGAADSDYYRETDFGKLGLNVEKVGQNQLVCRDSDKTKCVCLEPLPCEKKGDCVSFDFNVDAFRKALKDGQANRTVQCDWAETGSCGTFRYFAFDGDAHRFEVRWFDQGGRLVAQRNWTDYAAFCGKRATTLFMGRIPKCGPMKREQVLCGKPEGRGARRSPIEEFTLRTN